LPRNQGMLRICSKLGFQTDLVEADHLIHSELIL
jgi:hypothetical protein